MKTPKNCMVFIRSVVFGMKQIQFAEMLGVTQPAVAQWEAKGFCHYEEQLLIHRLALRLKLDWDTVFFFEIPKNWRTRYGGKGEGHQEGE